MIEACKADIAREKISQFMENMRQLGYGKEQIIELMQQLQEGEKE